MEQQILATEKYKLLKKVAGYFVASYFWVNDGARTHDPRYHKPML